MKKVSVIGAGTMGMGIAQIAATYGHTVCLYDNFQDAIKIAQDKIEKILLRLIEKDRITLNQKIEILSRINFSNKLSDISNSDFVVEAIIEDLDIKKEIFSKIEAIVSTDCIIATNTSSLSIASIASACESSSRVIGVHFFNPAPLMPLVEIIPSVQTSKNTLNKTKNLILEWKKIAVEAKDTPGFIVNRVARPFYGEAIRIYEEGIASFSTIDWAMKEIGGFKMGPFELMDYIGNDVNYTVTETVFKSFYYDPRYKPAFTQKRLKEAGYLGRKSGKGFYDYSSPIPIPNTNHKLGEQIFIRILAMLVNEAADAVYLNIASKEDIELAMKKGVNYPKGLLKWADEIGLKKILTQLENLLNLYNEDRYRPSPLLKKLIENNKTFF